MPAGYVVFHHGVDLSAIRSLDDKYVAFTARDFHEKAVFSSLEAWYVESLRKEYGERYGLGLISFA